MILTFNTPALPTGANDKLQATDKDAADSAESGLFGDILGTQKGPPVVDNTPAAELSQFFPGGKELPLDGKELPELEIPTGATADSADLFSSTLSVATGSQVTVVGEVISPVPVKPGPHLPLDPLAPEAAGPDLQLSVEQSAQLPVEQYVQLATDPDVQVATASTGPLPVDARSIGTRAPDVLAGLNEGPVPGSVSTPIESAPLVGADSPVAAELSPAVSGESVEPIQSLPRLDLTAVSKGNGSAAGNAAAAPALPAAAAAPAGSGAETVVDDGFRIDGAYEPLELAKVQEQIQLKAQPQPLAQATPVSGGIQLPSQTAELPAGLKIDVPATVTTPLGQPGWSEEIAGRINILVEGGKSEASLKLSPAELGRLEIRISTDDDQARIVFSVQNAAAREAIEQAMPRLREMLEQSGLQLAQSTVADQSGSGQRDRSVADAPSEGFSDLEQDSEEPVHEGVVLAAESTVDYYV